VGGGVDRNLLGLLGGVEDGPVGRWVDERGGGSLGGTAGRGWGGRADVRGGCGPYTGPGAWVQRSTPPVFRSRGPAGLGGVLTLEVTSVSGARIAIVEEEEEEIRVAEPENGYASINMCVCVFVCVCVCVNIYICIYI